MCDTVCVGHVSDGSVCALSDFDPFHFKYPHPWDSFEMVLMIFVPISVIHSFNK